MKTASGKIKQSVLASIIMEVEPLEESDKLEMLDAIRKRKSVLQAFNLDQKTKKNSISLNEIVAETKKVRKLRNTNASK